MKLKDYLYFNGITIRKFAQMLDYTPTHVGGIVRKNIKPSAKLARKINLETQGEVSIEELMGDTKLNDIFGED